MELLTIILTILKGIGVFLLALLLIFLILLLLVVLMPIRYRAEGSYNAAFSVSAKVSWFLGLLKANVSYHESLDFKVKIFGIQFFPKKGKPAFHPAEKKAEKKAAAAGQGETKKSSSRNADEQEGSSLSSNSTAAESAEPADMDPQNLNKQSIPEKIGNFFSEWKTKILNICDKIKTIRDNLDHYKKILQREDVQRALINSLKRSGRILMHIRPRKLQVIAHVGMKNPAVTGQIMAIQGILHPWLRRRVIIYPYFEEEKMEGQFSLEGYTVLSVLLFRGLQIVLNKDFLTLIRVLRKKEEA